jgi:hypothetical protein
MQLPPVPPTAEIDQQEQASDGLGLFESPERFARACVRSAGVLAVVGITGLVDRRFLLPMAGLLLVFAGLAWFVGTDRLDQLDESPDDEAPAGLPHEAGPPPVQRILDAFPPSAPVEGPTPPRLVPRTFRLPAAVGAERAWIVGDFNEWSHTSHPMRLAGDHFELTVDLEPGRSYRYRYLLDGGVWENDWQADAYVSNAFGTEDSVAHV